MINPDNGHGAADEFGGGDDPLFVKVRERAPLTLGAAHCGPDGRRSVPPGVPTDRVRLHVALWKMAQTLGLGWQTVDASKPDHELVEEVARALEPALAKAIVDGYDQAYAGEGLNTNGQETR